MGSATEAVSVIGIDAGTEGGTAVVPAVSAIPDATGAGVLVFAAETVGDGVSDPLPPAASLLA